MKVAPCLGLTHLFFSPTDDQNPKSEPGRAERIKKAKAICHDCPVVDECLEWALRIQLGHGIAGGLTQGERRLLLKGRRKGY